MNIILLSDCELNDGLGFFKKSDERFLHIKKVLKLKVGDKFKAGIIDGKIGQAEIIDFTSSAITFTFLPVQEPTALFPIHLILGFPRPIQLKRILRDIASLGVETVSLVGTELGEKSYLVSSLSKDESIRKMLLDGCSQAGSTLLPKFALYKSVGDFMNKNVFEEASLKLLLDIDKDCMSLPEVNKSYLGGKIYLAIGSERGWSDSEREVFAKNNFIKCSMGERILRTETASVSAISTVLAVCNFWR